ncbi:NAD(P)-dependent oxidoreductase [Pararhizobium sp. IMCC21322]|uniref:NAD-dependent epimerase/dehydratase family protein n=1 Tax=Pararhizobium sp. IMCC21322 TaxID=3067903 RepID=UPI002742523B|nr:NAD-dependent epimerase/dehydratase family protein [Pararhizobium sp. IMCC21322]
MTQDNAARGPFMDEAALEAALAAPDAALRADLAKTSGDLIVLGAGGKMGPSLARLARNAMAEDRKVIAVARFSESGLRDTLERDGIETIAADLLDRDAVAALPDAENVMFMAGRKFGSSGAEHLTWAMNALCPALVAERYASSRIIAFSTGCVYPFWPVDALSGPTEDVAPNPPPGDYAWSCVARERMFEHMSVVHNTPGRLFRLNYAIDVRYGVLHDLAQKVLAGEPIDVSMGHVTLIWQGEANARALRSLAQTTTPTSPINVTGEHVIAVRDIAEAFAKRFDKPANIVGTEAPTAWLNDASASMKAFGPLAISLEDMIDWQADWLIRGGRSLDKPTHFEARDGKY